MYVTCYYGFSPRRASHRRISTRKQCRKTQTHTDIPSGCTQDHWQAVIESVSIWVSLVAMNECLTWISHTTWWMSSMRLKNACFEYMLVHKLAVSYKSHIRQTNQTIRSAKRPPSPKPDRTSLLQDQSEASTAHFYNTYHKYTTKVNTATLGGVSAFHTCHTQSKMYLVNIHQH